jgi:hypothetical protein
MYCPRCRSEVFGGSICHLCGGPLSEGEETQETPTARGGVAIIARKRHRVSKEFGQTVAGRVARVMAEIVIFCAAFYVLSYLVVVVANWLASEMALDTENVKHIQFHGQWMRYFILIGFGVIIILTVKLRFRPGK